MQQFDEYDDGEMMFDNTWNTMHESLKLLGIGLNRKKSSLLCLWLF